MRAILAENFQKVLPNVDLEMKDECRSLHKKFLILEFHQLPRHVMEVEFQILEFQSGEMAK